jgi:prepilin-type N-terminal cleavage/methylation domain-containing protein
VKGRQGFTLMELLVVLLIIGILSTVALRTIDATRDRGLFDQTTKEMNQLVHAMVGNPDLAYDGRRVDFGYYGDMEKLPDSLRDLVQNTTGSMYWHGPYFKLLSAGDSVSYLYDGWGRAYAYNPGRGEITSYGNGKYSMTVKAVDDMAQLDTGNIIAGTITDSKDAAPGVQNQGLLSVRLYYNSGDSVALVVPEPSGYYEFNYRADSVKWRHVVPIGIHKLVAATATESLVRYVTVVPRSKTVVDFKFTSSFWGGLHMDGQPTNDGNGGFLIHIVNYNPDNVIINWLCFFNTPDSAYMREFRIDTDHEGYPIANGLPGTGPGDTIHLPRPVTIAGNHSQLVELWFGDFHVDPPGTDSPTKLSGKTFEFRFSDQSDITATIP